LVALGAHDKAQERLEDLAVPPETDPAFGWSALARARLLVQKEEWQAALEAGIETVAFDTKDIDSFPAALLLAAKCYEELGEWYRARDVYFAVGRLTRKTAAEAYAMARLKYILDKGLTDEDEAQAIHHVFFSGREDLNGEAKQLVESYIERRKQEGQDTK
jgi:hypothetical protein